MIRCCHRLAVPTGFEPATSGLTGRRELQTSPQDQILNGTYNRTPNGIRTRATTLKGWCPRPLDDVGKDVEFVGRAPETYQRQRRVALGRICRLASAGVMWMARRC